MSIKISTVASNIFTKKKKYRESRLNYIIIASSAEPHRTDSLSSKVQQAHYESRLFTIHDVNLRKDTIYNRRGISSSPTDESRYSRSLYKETEGEEKRERERERGRDRSVCRSKSLNVSKTEFNLPENRRWKFVPNII